jgi:hypothetical protein
MFNVQEVVVGEKTVKLILQGATSIFLASRKGFAQGI